MPDTLFCARSSQVLVIDVQDGLIPHVFEAERFVTRVKVLVSAAQLLGVPTSFAEQYPRGLGHTVVELRDKIGEGTAFEKTTFSCLGNDGLAARLNALKAQGRRNIILAGCEAHVCVLQTALDLIKAGFTVGLVADAVSSRAAGSVDLALQRLRAAGAIIVNTEMMVFEWLERADRPDFRAASALVR